MVGYGFVLCTTVVMLQQVRYVVCVDATLHRRHDDRYGGVDVRRLAKFTQGTELLMLENNAHGERTYKLEDFFWTGSGDDGVDDDWSSTIEPTVYTTKTVVSTVYVSATSTTLQTNQSTELPTLIPTGDIDPTPTYPTDAETNLEADEQFWLLTVLRSDGKDPDVAELKRSLTNLYKKAFLRQQAKHLGIEPRIKRDVKEKPVDVYIHRVDRTRINGDEKVKVVYHVAVAGQPVDAVTAASDMSLVTDDEVKAELGFPFYVKAEPYIKPTSAQELGKDQEPAWVYVGISSVVVLLILLAVILMTVCISKRQETLPPARKFDSRQENLEESNPRKPSPTYIDFRENQERRSSSTSSLDISPVVTKHKKLVRPKAAINKTVPLNNRASTLSLIDSDATTSTDTIFIPNCDPGVVSPKSYLSMPSVKSFPRGNNPEPLNKVLEPVSVLHLDDDESYESQASHTQPFMIQGYNRQVTQPNTMYFGRHGSVGASEDPGVLGPIVWNLHQQRLSASLDDEQPTNASKMRKRFHELLDDTFTLFGSRTSTPVAPETSPINPIKVRPKTSTNPIPTGRNASRKGAWMSGAPSPLERPLSAPYVRPYTAPTPQIDVARVLIDGAMSKDDPAVPLIAEIKKEIDRCTLPGSTANLNE